MYSLGTFLLAAHRWRPTTGEAVVHVVESDVEVTIGEDVHHNEGRLFDPIVRELPPGRHDLVVSRNGRIPYEQTYEIRRGRSLVLTAWDPERLHPGLDACDPSAESPE